MRLATVVKRLERLGVDRAHLDAETRAIAHQLGRLLRPLGLEIRRVGRRTLVRRGTPVRGDRETRESRRPHGLRPRPTSPEAPHVAPPSNEPARATR